jgi:atypical dual specificity phosphatase
VNPDKSAGTDEDPVHSKPLVRPKGYAAEKPVVRRIGDRNLYLGNEPAAHPETHDRTFEYVLSTTAEKQPCTTHHRPLTDGRRNEWSVFEAAVDTARTLHRRDGSLLVHCKAGVSRSTTVIATTLAAEEDREFRDALDIVQAARPYAMPNPALHELAVIYLAAES